MLPDLKATRPQFTLDEARVIAAKHFGSADEAKELASERDQNFLITGNRGEALVLKIANGSEERAILELQHAALNHIRAEDSTLPVPRVLTDEISGEAIFSVRNETGGEFFVRALSFVQGTPLAHYRPHTAKLFEAEGAFFARLVNALANFHHPAMERELYWDLAHASKVIQRALPLMADADRAIIERVLEDERELVTPHSSSFPRGVIHNDGNDHNVIVDPPRPPESSLSDAAPAIGLIDFGDMVSTPIVHEIAIACAYAMLNKLDPLSAAGALIKSFHKGHALSEAELESLPSLIRLRLALSVANSARQTREEPDNEYLRVSEGAAWDLLRRLDGIASRFAVCRFREACGFSAHRKLPLLEEALAGAGKNAYPLFGQAMSETELCVLDLSVGSPELGTLASIEKVEVFERWVETQLENANASLGIGRYAEPRLLYRSEHFAPRNKRGEEPRTVHLGIDCFAPAGTEIHAPLSGKIHSFAINRLELDYGPTIVLEHELDGINFFTLYGHLSEDSLAALEVGTTISKGSVFARIGNYPNNGNWPPHLHFQIIADLFEMTGDFPGVARPSEQSTWLSLCPDPNLLLNIPRDELDPIQARRDSAKSIAATRRRHLSPNLSVSYASPLHIVRGKGAFLYDSDGRAYLDMVNNVCHVGHCHPYVVEAARAQIAVLNTNTRYLHENIVEYAERLAAKCPDPLSVCFFVNSGSEANDLALRIARTHSKSDAVIVLDGAYHGNLSSLIDVSPYKFAGPGGKGPPTNTLVISMPDKYRGRYREDGGDGGESEDVSSRYLDEMSTVIAQARQEGVHPAAFISEAIMSCGGQIVFPEGYLNSAQEIMRNADIVNISDEVQVGFGRVGTHFWAFEAEEARPDIITMGKPIGNGHPLAAVVTTPELAESFHTGMEYFNTFGGNPVSCAVGMAVLEVIEREELQENAAVVGRGLIEGLRRIASRRPIIGDVRGRGLFLGFELVRDPETLEPADREAAYLVERLRARGILNSTDGPLHNVIKLKPPMVFSKADAEYYLETLDEILDDDCLQID